MSVQAISWVIDHSKQKLGPLVVLLMVANHTRSNGTGAWPSISTLAKESRMSERQVQRCLKGLAKSGELRVEHGKGPYGTNMYSFPRMGGDNLSPLGDKSGSKGMTNQVNSMSKMSPNPSLKRTVHKDKHGNFYLLGPDGIRTIIGPAEAAEYGYGEEQP